MAHGHIWEILLRVPCIFLLDSCLSLKSESLYGNWLTRKIVHFACISLSALLCLCTTSKIVMIYYIAMLLIDMTVVLYLNILNTSDIYSKAVFNGSLLEVPNAPLTLPTLVLSWIFFVFSIYMYANAFASLKPAVLSVLFIPVIVQYNSNSNGPPLLLTCICFGVIVFILLEMAFTWICQLWDYVRLQFRILTEHLRMYGVFLVIFLHWRRLSVQAALVVYWVLIWNLHFASLSVFIRPCLSLSYLLASLAYSCDSYVRVVAFCYIIYYASKAILGVIKRIFHDDNVFLDDGQHRPNGLRESVGFFLLSLYTNFPSVDASKRIVLMELISLLLISALIRSSFEVVEPYLLALHSAPAQQRQRHYLILSFCFFLVFSSVYFGILLYKLRERFPFSIPNVITVIQITCAVLLYALYMYDSRRDGAWEELDDCVYYVKGTCRALEFILIVSVLGYRIFDTSLEWTVFQLLMVVLHMYVNVYLPLRDGWESISLRRLVNKKLNALPVADQEQIEGRNDVCAICLDDMHAARVTPCNHIFHKVCLRKWLKIQNKCPLCHTSILAD
eukprot:gene5313-5981_t